MAGRLGSKRSVRSAGGAFVIDAAGDALGVDFIAERLSKRGEQHAQQADHAIQVLLGNTHFLQSGAAAVDLLFRPLVAV